MAHGAMWACVVAMERKVESSTGRGAWEVVLKVSRRRR
jgi:hypothetical protein